MEFNKPKLEALLRLTAIFLLVLTAFIVALDTQTKLIFFLKKKASFTDLKSFVGLVYVISITAAYNLLQLCRYSFQAWFEGISKKSYRYLAWLCYFLDQGEINNFSCSIGNSVRCVCYNLSGVGASSSGRNRGKKPTVDEIMQQIHQILLPNRWGSRLRLHSIAHAGYGRFHLCLQLV
ncbi:hypothetical protein SLEP1_g13161 [Rubroshorea leprosula]|uniref:CASP-like protein n=1 Tax=Rubroshorea leprosula TaxID=152421 RepID=A0AAV5IPM2_9ROSI|nr:hypothetical protein SLEP1_g13161 [Rubroshorea leprosula]